jgi:hypothetical protein
VSVLEKRVIDGAEGAPAIKNQVRDPTQFAGVAGETPCSESPSRPMTMPRPLEPPGTVLRGPGRRLKRRGRQRRILAVGAVTAGFVQVQQVSHTGHGERTGHGHTRGSVICEAP